MVDIETVYLDGNASSHFRAVADSLRVFAPLLLFGLSSLLAFFVDTVALLVLEALSGSLITAVIGARAASASINSAVNRLVVFEHGRRTSLGRSASRYLALAAILLAANYGVLDALTSMGVPLLAAKIGTEAALFAVSFGLQRSIVFAAPSAVRGGERVPGERDSAIAPAYEAVVRG